MKNFYCANCGKRLSVIRRALPKYSTIVDLVQYHECSAKPLELDINPTEDTKLAGVPAGKDKFVQSLNKLNPISVVGKGPDIGNSVKRSSMTGTDDLRDRRFDHEEPVKSSAPGTVLSMLKGMQNSIPSRELISEPEPESEA
jgi:hypothetical protein